MRDRSEFMLVWPLTILAVSAMILLAVSMFLGGREIDAKVRQHEERLVNRAIDGRILVFEQAFAPQIARDAAVSHLDNAIEPEWARTNLPVYLKPTIGAWDYLVLDAQDRPVWASLDEAPMPPEQWARFRRQAEPLVAELRALERRRGPPVVVDGVAPKPVVITRIEPRDGRAYMWMAGLVQPDSHAVTLKGRRASLVVAGGFITDVNIATIQRAYALKDLHIVTDARRAAVWQARSPFQMIPGAPQTALIWTPQRPSHDLLLGAGWTIAAVLAAFLALGVLMFRRTRKAAHDLMEVHRAQREFLANMSHEIRTPLNGVNALADMLRKTPLESRQRGMVETIHSSGVMLERLLTDILDLARLDAEGMALELKAFNLATAVNSVMALMAARARDRGLDLKLDLDPAAEGMVMGDITRLKQVLTNLISNAIKFTDEGGVTLTVRQGVRGAWRFEVRDTGIGFDPAIKDRLFERFQQADGSVTRKSGGAGLGLAISRGLAVKMGGELDAESELGQGAVFILKVPLPPAPATPETAAEPEAPRAAIEGARLKVLVSEDHPVNRMVMEMMLDSIGADIVSTADGQAACEAFESQTFHMILMDMQMPVMDGLSAIRRIRERERVLHLPRTPIIMVTANALPEHRAAGLAAGADVFLTKPVDGDRLLEAMEELRSDAVA